LGLFVYYSTKPSKAEFYIIDTYKNRQ